MKICAEDEEFRSEQHGEGQKEQHQQGKILEVTEKARRRRNEICSGNAPFSKREYLYLFPVPN